VPRPILDPTKSTSKGQEKMSFKCPTVQVDLEDIEWKTHESYLQICLNGLPPALYASQDPNKLTLVYFVIASHELLGHLDKLPKQQVIDWIYSLQVVPDKDDPDRNKHNCGWRGSSFLGLPFDPSGQPVPSHPHDQGHIAMTYVALAMLLMLGDDLSRVHKKAIISSLPYLQQPSGSVSPSSGGCESDMRYVYCACCISYMLNDWSGFDKERAANYIFSSQSYDYGIGQAPSEESHGGSTYCALASLSLMGRLQDLPNKDKLLQWLIYRQELGFNGRPNKLHDTCYSFWVGASILLLGHLDLIMEKYTRNFTLSCQRKFGGFAKLSKAKQPADVLHTYFALCGLSFIGEPGIAPVHPSLGFSVRAHDRLMSLYPNFEPLKL